MKGLNYIMSQNNYLQRKLKIIITLEKGEFKQGSNSIEIEDLGMNVIVDKLPPPDFSKASVEIYNLSLEKMQRLTTLSMHPLFIKQNYINIYAGDNVHGYNLIFRGAITGANADFNTAPDVKFKIDARVGFYGSVTAQGGNVINGVQDASIFISNQVKKCGFTFENQNVKATLKNAVFFGSPIEQARQASAQIGAELILDDDKAILINSGAVRKSGDIPLISADSGLLGYPTMSQNGIDFRTIFNPNYTFAGLVELKSIIPKVSGQWRIIKLSHHLSANLPNNGEWTSQITAYYPEMSGITGKFI